MNSSLVVNPRIRGTLAACIVGLAFLVTAYSTTLAQTSQTGKQADRAKRAQEMETKVTTLVQEFVQLGSSFKEVSDQAAVNAKAEWKMARRDLQKVEAELHAEYAAAVGELSQSVTNAWEELESGKAEAAKNLAATRAEWDAWSRRMQRQHRARVSQMRDEIVKLDQQAKSASQETRQRIVAARTEIRQQYEFDVKELQSAYQEYINSLEAEMARIDKNVQQADDQMSAALAEQSGQVTQQMHAAYEELQASYHDVVSKANAYITSTKAWLNDSSAETKAKVQSELDNVSHKSRQMQAEMVATYKAQQESLEEQIASLKAHSTKATGETKRELDEVVVKLQAAHEAATKRYEEAHDAYVTDLNEHIDEMRASIAEAGEESRERMIEAIEARQAQLENAKQKLKERK